VASERGPVVVDTDVYSARLIPDSTLARRYEPLLVGRAEFVSFQTVAEVRYGALLRRWGDARLRRIHPTQDPSCLERRRLREHTGPRRGNRAELTPPSTWPRPSRPPAERYLCEMKPGRPLRAAGSGIEVLVKVERPQRSEDVRPWPTRGPVQTGYGPVGDVGAPCVTWVLDEARVVGDNNRDRVSPVR